LTYPANSANYISPANSNKAFAPPASGSTTTNVLGGALYASTKCTPAGWSGDYAAIGQVKTTKNSSGAEISFTNPLVTVPFAGPGSKGATVQNAITKLATITDGTSHTTLYSERSGKSKQYYSGYVSDATPIQTGAIWADADNRITVTGTSADGKSGFASGPSVMNSNPLTLSSHTVTFLVLSGLATGASWVYYFRALKVGEASKVAPVDKLSLVLVAIFATIFLGERPNMREWLGIVLVGVGGLILGFKR
jgi:hypothetical protein